MNSTVCILSGCCFKSGIDMEQEHLKYRLSSEEFLAMELKDSGKVIGNIYCGKRDDMSSHGSPVIHPGSYCIYAPGDTPLMLGIIPCIR